MASALPCANDSLRTVCPCPGMLASRRWFFQWPVRRSVSQFLARRCTNEILDFNGPRDT